VATVKVNMKPLPSRDELLKLAEDKVRDAPLNLSSSTASSRHWLTKLSG
jgi:hypothetical protein